ncbi:MAG: hypothetical protein M1828_004700 [Chrysothrix sp. TS-e1954]|nr:MAG: hypothetical protein M1828_004700 [Chrysothrix sp. TS-e1954]
METQGRHFHDEVENTDEHTETSMLALEAVTTPAIHERLDSLALTEGMEDHVRPSLNESRLSSREAIEVCRQVDYYFSNENLKGDKFLLGKMRGRRNRPVPVKIIHTFRKMQQYQPLQAVIAALHECNNVDLVKETGLWCVQRKTPFVSEEVLGHTATFKPSKMKPTGFEEFYADGPMTAVDAQHEESLYHGSRSVTERIETALQRYQAKRKFSNRPRNVFDKWLRYGGVDAGQKMFSGGLDPAFVEDSSKAEIAAMTATTYLGDDKQLDGQWTVAFDEVASSFLSVQVPSFWSCEYQSDVSECVGILRNFYNYLLHHDVCPEHAQDILAARKTAHVAEKELFETSQALRLLPGDFNVACSTLFGGFYTGLYAESQSWTNDAMSPSIALGMSDLRAGRVLKFGIAQYAPESMFDLHEVEQREPECKQKQWDIVKEWTLAKTEADVGLEICEVQAADAETRKNYEQSSGNPKSLGILRCRSWTSPVYAEDDLPPGVSLEVHARYELFVEDEVLACLRPGMKLHATVYTLSSGIQFFDSVTSVKCSFYTALENELMLGFREPRTISREEQLDRERGGAADGSDNGEEADLD